MAAAATAAVKFKINSTLSNTIGLGTTSSLAEFLYTASLASGTGADQINKVWTSDDRSIAASSSETHDVAGGLTDALGATVTMTKVKGIAIKAASTNTNNVVVGGATSNGLVNWVGDATDVINIRPGGCLVLIAPDSTGYAVTAGTGDLLKISNSSSGTPVVYDIALLGVG